MEKNYLETYDNERYIELPNCRVKIFWNGKKSAIIEVIAEGDFFFDIKEKLSSLKRRGWLTEEDINWLKGGKQ